MKKLHILLTWLFLPCSFSSPGNRTGQVESNARNNISDVSSTCYFSQLRKNELEKMERPVKSVVTDICSGATKRIGDVVKDHKEKHLVEENGLALLLCRGAGMCDLDISDPAVFKKWNDVQICEHHADELLSKWNDVHSGFALKHMYRTKTSHGTVFACSMPDGIGDHHSRRPITRLQPLTIKEANAILTEQNVLVHPGIPLCHNHKTFSEKLVPISSTPSPKRSKMELHYSSDSEDDTCPIDPLYLPYDNRIPPLKRSFLDFAAGVGLSRVCTNVSWKKLQMTTKERKASAARRLIDTMLQLMVPDDTKDFRDMVQNKFIQLNDWTTGSSDDLDAIMRQISEHYFVSEDRNNRILILSLVCNSVSYLKVEKYIPGLRLVSLSYTLISHSKIFSRFMYEKAKKFARRKRNTRFASGGVVKYNKEAVEAFIEFITSPTVMIGLPYGTRKVKLSDGSKVEIPNSIRQQSSTEIIEMFKTICEDNHRQDLLLPVSTMYKILNACAATQREATTCVDYFVATGMESFDGLHSILDFWRDFALFDSDVIKQMKRELFQAAQYLRTDYRLHVKNYSRIADHCANFALSDPNEAKLSASCSIGPEKHFHDVRCDRCGKLNAILDKIEAHAVEFVTEEEADAFADEALMEKHKEQLESIRKYKTGIFEMKKHLLRAAVTNEERRNITAELKENEALITLDFAQKFLPKWHREKQSDYFGKKGISYHISHVAALIGNVHVQHSFVHIFEGSVTQDSKLVIPTIEHFLKELKKVGIKKVFLRSDNAGAYHSAATIGSLHSLMETTKVVIGSYTFSEAQNGKSSSDRDANRVKRRVKEYINKGNDVTTSADFFKALKENPPNGVSVFHGTVTTTEDGGTEWKGISNMNYFIIEKNGVRAKRYGGLGVGIFVEKSQLKPIKGTSQFVDKAGFLASEINSDLQRNAEKEAVQNGQSTKFWYHPKCSKTGKCLVESDDVAAKIIDSVPNNVIGDLYACPEPGCSSTFLKYFNLEKHILRGKHNVAPEKLTERDYALNFYAKKLEDANSAETCPIVGKAVEQMKESKPDGLLAIGWALPEKRTRKTFSKNVVTFLIECYDEGVKKKRPMNPFIVEKLMRDSKKFKTDELLSGRQIAGFFSREADKRRHQHTTSTSVLSSNKNQTRRSLKEHHGSPNRRHKKHTLHLHRRRRTSQLKESINPPVEEFSEDEEEHADAGWIRFMKIEEFWTLGDEFFNASISSPDPIFLPF